MIFIWLLPSFTDVKTRQGPETTAVAISSAKNVHNIPSARAPRTKLCAEASRNPDTGLAGGGAGKIFPAVGRPSPDVLLRARSVLAGAFGHVEGLVGAIDQ
ncbi:MAG TPA: hypothetical protein VLR50_15950, partial [Desulfobacterales bacterium]|nr:hypothetical protein [Desulfobacterales bacterium]